MSSTFSKLANLIYQNQNTKSLNFKDLIPRLWTLFVYFTAKFLSSDPVKMLASNTIKHFGGLETGENGSGLLKLFEWGVTLFICFFGKFERSTVLKEMVEKEFDFKLGVSGFNSKLGIIKTELRKAARSVFSQDAFVDITSQEAKGRFFLI